VGKGAKGGAHSSWETFAWERRSSWRIELGFDALEDLEEAASVQIWRLGATFTIYLQERFHLGGGRMALAGCLSPGGISSHQNLLMSVAL
jgi:hypothetical protein